MVWYSNVTDTQQRFVERALRRKKLFLALSIVGIVIAAVLAAYYGFRRLNDPTFPIGPRAVIVVLILLNSRQNLRQYRFASFIEDDRKKAGARLTPDA
jgi:formate-dependent nitrite reductase membrane component NrfD